MIIEAWYTISEYHLHMGSVYGDESRNAIERAVNYLQSITDLSSSVGRDKIANAINSVKDNPDFQKIILQMTDDVPYRLIGSRIIHLTGSPTVDSIFGN